jgi:S-DNA-T family DNA segregation ATPase FtsK/SpoIIIE
VDRLARLQTHFGRFLWDILGVFLCALALLTLLGIFGLSKGSLLEQWVNLLYVWFGWGDLLIVLFSGAGAVLAFRRSLKPVTIHWHRIIALELAAFLTLALISVFSGNRLSEDGMWGGQVGWGLAMVVVRYIGPIWGGLVILILWGLALLTAFGLWNPLENWLLRQAGAERVEELEPSLTGSEVQARSEDPLVSPLPSDKAVDSSNAAGKKPVQKLPPEFRKSFKVEERQDSRPAAPKPRSERLPPLNVLLGEQSVRPDERNINQTAGLIEKSLSEFGIPAKVVGFRIGPTVTQFSK